MHQKGTVTFDDLKLNFEGSMPDSLEMRYIKRKFPNQFLKTKRQIAYLAGEEMREFTRTTAIIDVSFAGDWKEMIDTPVTIYAAKNKGNVKKELITLNQSYGATKMGKRQIYRKLYNEGFDIEGVHYVRFKRSASKSRLSQTLFIDQNMLDEILLWSRMGLQFDEDESCDVASLMAYESLTFSGIIGTVAIKPKEILLIDDFVSSFTARASVTRYDDKLKRLTAAEMEVKQTSDIFDGESLLDGSKFTGAYQGKGCLLLRNKFFKSCAFNTNIQKWFADNNITQVSQLHGITLAKNISDIKLITTPNSLKAMKFAYKLECEKCDEKKAMFRYWIKHIDSNYGVCKFEKPSQFDARNQLSYQMLNSLPLSYDDVLNLAQFNIKQIDNINNNFAYFKEYIRTGDEIDVTREMLYNLCCINSDVQHTKLYKEKRNEIVKKLKKNMLNGRLLVNSDYAVMTSNPIEMLKCACGIDWHKSIHEKYEIYTPMFNDGEELVGFRNPHVASGNVCVFTNRRIADIDAYMNLTSNIVVINAFNNDVFARLQGADVDSDSCLLVCDETILKAGKECLKFSTPLNMIQGEKKPRKYNNVDIAEVDYTIGQNMIGQIINLSQLFNSYFWDYKSKGATEEQLQTIYHCVSILSSMSQMEIDKSKKLFTINTKGELKKIANAVFNQSKYDCLKAERKTLSDCKNRLKSKFKSCTKAASQYRELCTALDDNKNSIDLFMDKNRIVKLGIVKLQKTLLQDDECLKMQECEQAFSNGFIDQLEHDLQIAQILNYQKIKQCKPNFFENNAQDMDCCFKSFNTPMDFLTDIVKTKVKKAKADLSKMELTELLQNLDTGCASRRQAAKIKDIVYDVSQKLKFCYLTSKQMSFDGDGKFDYATYQANKKHIISQGICSMQKVKISKIETVLLLLKRCYCKNDNVKNDLLHNKRVVLTGLLYSAHTRLFMDCFTKSDKVNNIE